MGTNFATISLIQVFDYTLVEHMKIIWRKGSIDVKVAMQPGPVRQWIYPVWMPLRILFMPLRHRLPSNLLLSLFVGSKLPRLNRTEGLSFIRMYPANAAMPQTLNLGDKHLLLIICCDC